MNARTDAFEPVEYPVEHLRLRHDSLYNSITKAGGSNDLTSSIVSRPNLFACPLTNDEIDAAYRDIGLARRVVNGLPADIGRRGWRLIGEGLDASAFSGLARRLKIIRRVVQAQQLARKNGNAAIVMVTNAPEDTPPGDLTWLRTPLEPSQVQSLRALHVLEGRTEITVTTTDGNFLSPTFGEPQMYRAQPAVMTGSRSIEIHGSRVAWFRGTDTPRRARLGRIYDDPLLWSVWTEIQRWCAGQASVSVALARLQDAVLAVNGLAAFSQSEGADDFAAFVQAIAKSRSMYGVTVVPGGSDFKTQVNSPTGVSEALGVQSQAVAAVTGQPFTTLFGEPPSGFNTDGESQRQTLDRVIGQEWALMLEPVSRIYEVMMLAMDGPTGGVVPSEWELELEPPDEMTEGQAAEALAQRAATFSALVSVGVRPEIAAQVASIDLPEDPDSEAGDLTVSGILGDALAEALWVSAPVDATTIERARTEAMRIVGTELVARGAPHLTLLYLGADHTEEDAAELVGITEDVAARSQPGTLMGWRVTTFPPGEHGTPVVLESQDGGWSARGVHEALLRGAAHLIHARQHPDFRAHITLGYLREPPTEEQVAALGEIDAVGLEVPLTLLRVAAGERTLSTVALRG